jgi:hypothetical protein
VFSTPNQRPPHERPPPIADVHTRAVSPWLSAWLRVSEGR